MLSDLQRKYIELEKKKAEYKLFIEEFTDVTKQLAEEVGVGNMFQDEEGTVYQVDIPNGKFVYFDQFTVNRTRREGEKSGSLSLKAAREAGFEVT